MTINESDVDTDAMVIDEDVTEIDAPKRDKGKGRMLPAFIKVAGDNLPW